MEPALGARAALGRPGRPRLPLRRAQGGPGALTSPSVYLDHAGLAPVDPRVIAAMAAARDGGLGDPSALHAAGRRARALIDEARAHVGRLVDGVAEGVVFTSGATEANNLALRGVTGRAAGRHVVTSVVEHVSILNACRDLAKRGWDVSFVPVDHDGRLDPEAVEACVRSDTALVSIGAANGEIGTVQPIREIGERLRRRGVPFHVDAVHAAGRIPLGVSDDEIDLLTLSSNDLYGPAGVGALWVRPGVALEPVTLGGGQERGLRSGTENVVGIAGFGAAADFARAEHRRDSARVGTLRDALLEALLAGEPDARLTGARPPGRLPHHVSLIVRRVKAEAVLMEMDLRGVAASSGSTCATLTGQPSHVLRAIGVDGDDAEGSLVLTLGRWTTAADVDRARGVVIAAVTRLRRLSAR